MICKSCGRGGLEPIIRSRPFLIVKESVTENELTQGQLFALSSPNRYGTVTNSNAYYLAKELGMVGLNLQTMSLSALFLHKLPEAKRSKADKEVLSKCCDHSIADVIRIARDMNVVMLMGAEVVRTFTGYGVSDVSGLICKSELLPTVPVIVPAPNPDKLMSQPIGELRNALKVFAEQIEIFEQYERM